MIAVFLVQWFFVSQNLPYGALPNVVLSLAFVIVDVVAHLNINQDTTVINPSVAIHATLNATISTIFIDEPFSVAWRAVYWQR